MHQPGHSAISEQAERRTRTVSIPRSPPNMAPSSEMLSALRNLGAGTHGRFLYQTHHREAKLRSTFKCILFHTKARFALPKSPENLLKDGALVFAVSTKILHVPPINNSTCVQGGRVDRCSVKYLS